jgi:hypothetical protein
MKSHHTQDKGDLGVLKAKLDLLNKGYTILKPEAEHAPFDIVAYKREKFIRVQVKYWPRSLSEARSTKKRPESKD